MRFNDDVNGSVVARIILGALLVGMFLFLEGCTAGDALRARGVTVDDALAYAEENHVSRKANRAEHETFVYDRYHRVKNFGDRVWDSMVLAWAKDEKNYKEKMAFAVDLWAKAEGLLADSYRPLATVELIKEGGSVVDEVRRVFRDESPPEETPPD